MSSLSQDFAHRTAVEVYGAFLDECVNRRVIDDRVINAHDGFPKKRIGRED